MQVNSVSLSPSANNTAFKASLEEQVFANLKDSDLRKIAWAKTSKDVNDRKHRRIDNALFLSLPLSAGLAAVSQKFSPEAIEFIGKKNLRAVKFANFGLTAAGWVAGLGALGLLWDAKDYLSKKVDVVKNNPVISTMATFVAGFGVLAAVNKLGAKGLTKIVKSVDQKKVLPYLVKARNALNNNKVLNKISEFASKFPSPIKDIARGAAGFAPMLVIGTYIGHFFGHQSVKAKVANKNYQELIQAQQNIRENIADEKIDKKVHSKTIAELKEEYEQMLKTKPIMDAQTDEPITFEQFVKLATTKV